MPYLGAIFGALAFYLVRRKDEYEPRNIGLFILKENEDMDSSALDPLASGSASPGNLKAEVTSTYAKGGPSNGTAASSSPLIHSDAESH
jgi:hypothetical protein